MIFQCTFVHPSFGCVPDKVEVIDLLISYYTGCKRNNHVLIELVLYSIPVVFTANKKYI